MPPRVSPSRKKQTRSKPIIPPRILFWLPLPICTELEEQLEQTLSTIQGVGTCDVMITLRSTSIYQYAKDESRSDSSDRVEQKQDYVLIGNGTSEHALVQSIQYPEIQGVVIVCDGGENAVVKEQVYQVAAATLQIKNNQIYVAKRR